MSGRVEHLYVHLPFCAHRCGYCDFVTVVGHGDRHAAYVDAVLAELRLETRVLTPRLATIFLGGGTPTLVDARELARLLAALPPADEVTVEANPETVTPELGRLLRSHGVNRVSLGAQSFQPHLLEVLERRAGPEDVRRAFYHLRDACFDNISLDLIYGIPGQSPAHLDADLSEALRLGAEHISCYELEAKAGTRFAHRHGAALTRQADAMETYFERVVTKLTAAGYRWYETANFCRSPDVAGRDLRARHNLGYWLGRDYVGLGIGAVSTIAGVRRRNTPKLATYIETLAAGDAPPRELEVLSEDIRRRERVMLGLRLDGPVSLGSSAAVVDDNAVARLAQLGLVSRVRGTSDDELLLTRKGRFLGGAVTAELLA